MWVWKKAKIIMGMQVLLPKPTASVGVDMHQQWITAKVNPWTYCLRCISFHIHTAEAECLNLSDKPNFEMPLLLWGKKKKSNVTIDDCPLHLTALRLALTCRIGNARCRECSTNTYWVFQMPATLFNCVFFFFFFFLFRIPESRSIWGELATTIID